MLIVITYKVVFIIFFRPESCPFGRNSWNPVHLAGIPGIRWNSIGIPIFQWIPWISAGISGGVKSTGKMRRSSASVLTFCFFPWLLKDMPLNELLYAHPKGSAHRPTPKDKRKPTGLVTNKFLISLNISTSFSALTIHSLLHSSSSPIMPLHSSFILRCPCITSFSLAASSSLSCRCVSRFCAWIALALDLARVRSSAKREAVVRSSSDWAAGAFVCFLQESITGRRWIEDGRGGELWHTFLY